MSLLLDDVYFNGLIQGRGLLNRKPVNASTTANITLSGTQTIDGVAVVAGNRVLVKNQTDGKQNGIYDVSSGSWTRSQGYDLGNASGIYVYVIAGTSNGKQYFTCSNVFGSDIIGTNNLTFNSDVNRLTSSQTLTNKTLVDNLSINGITDSKIANISPANITIGTTRTYTFPNVNDTLITDNSTNTLYNKSFWDSLTAFSDQTDATKKFNFNLSPITTNTTRTITLPDFNGTIAVTATLQQTFTNKTILAPKINAIFSNYLGGINSSYHRQIVSFGSGGASATNYFSLLNAATGNAPILLASGADTNIPIQLKPKGNKPIRFLSTTDAGKTEYYNTTGNYVQIKAPGIISSSSYTLNFPTSTPVTAKQVLKSADLTGSVVSLQFSPDRVTYNLSNTINIVTTTPTVLATSGFPWVNSYYGSGGDFQLEDGYCTYLYKADSIAAAELRILTVELYNTTTSTVLGSDTQTVNTVNTITPRFSFTLPTNDARLQLRISATGSAGTIMIYGSSLDFGKY
jgi:hypothetical protein